MKLDVTAAETGAPFDSIDVPVFPRSDRCPPRWGYAAPRSGRFFIVYAKSARDAALRLVLDRTLDAAIGGIAPLSRDMVALPRIEHEPSKPLIDRGPSA